MSQPSDYTPKNIRVVEDCDHIRARPGMYVGATDERGLHHMTMELVGNSIDEALAGYGSRIEVAFLADGGCRVTDHGRGIPVHKVEPSGQTYLELALTQMFPEKRLKHPLKVAFALKGLGLKPANALSERLLVESHHEGQVWTQEYSRGRSVTPLECRGSTEHSGTRITFWPDPEIFGSATFDLPAMRDRLRELAFLHPPLTFEFRDQRPGFQVDLIQWFSRNNRPVHPNVVHANFHVPEGEIEVAFCWLRSTVCTVHSFVNFYGTSQGGTHSTGLQEGIADVWAERLRLEPVTRNGRPVSRRVASREGLLAAVHVQVQEPTFQGATKGQLNNPEIEAPVRALTRQVLEGFIRTHTDEAAAIIRHILEPQAQGS